MQDLTVTLVQAHLAWHDADANRNRLAESIGESAENADLVVLPEMFSSGFTMAAPEVAETIDGPSVRWMSGLARSSDAVVTGSLVIVEDGRYFNRLIWASPNGEILHYDKRHLFRMAGEHDHYHPGSDRLVASVAGWRVCPLICYDLRFPVWSRGVDEFELLLYVANWPAPRRSAWRTLLPARAVENLCYAAGVNRIGADENGVTYAGDSAVYDYLGHTVAALGDDDATLTVRLDGAALVRYRDKFPAWRDADAFSIQP